MNINEGTCDGFGYKVDVYAKVAEGYYNSKLPYYDSSFAEEIKNQIKDLDNVRLTVEERNFENKRLQTVLAEHNLQIRAKYNEAQDKLNAEFEADVEASFGFTDYPDVVKTRIHYLAYEEGHAGGYSNILAQYGELVEFADLCRREFSKCDK
jgi:hypothetical protein